MGESESECTRQLNYGYLHFICVCLIAGCHLSFLSSKFPLLFLYVCTTQNGIFIRSKRANFLRVKYAPFATACRTNTKKIYSPNGTSENIHWENGIWSESQQWRNKIGSSGQKSRNKAENEWKIFKEKTPCPHTHTHTQGRTNEEKVPNWSATDVCENSIFEIAWNRNRLLYSIVWLITNGFSVLCKWERWWHLHTQTEKTREQKKACGTFAKSFDNLAPM